MSRRELEITPLTSIYRILETVNKHIGFSAMQRKVMNEATWRMISELNVGDMDAFEISGSRWRTMPFKSYKNVDYPEIEIDVQPYPGQYDFIVAEQVWEHLRFPRRGAINAKAMLRDGGYLLITTPFLVRVHAHPNDCTRWTSEGMRYFLQDCGFDDASIKVNSWGNLAAVIANLTQWVPYDPSHNALHCLENDRFFPVAVWALARNNAPIDG